MIKIIGALIVFAISFEIGRRNSSNLSERVRTITGIEDGLIIMQNEISGLLATMPDAVKKAAVASDYFKEVGRKIEMSTPNKAFTEASQILEKEEKRVLESFAAGLGADNAEGQIRNIEVCRERIAMVRSIAEKRRDTLGKLYTAAGALSGIAAIIILL